jgi:hypothetical protein
MWPPWCSSRSVSSCRTETRPTSSPATSATRKVDGTWPSETPPLVTAPRRPTSGSRPPLTRCSRQDFRRRSPLASADRHHRAPHRRERLGMLLLNEDRRCQQNRPSDSPDELAGARGGGPQSTGSPAAGRRCQRLITQTGPPREEYRPSSPIRHLWRFRHRPTTRRVRLILRRCSKEQRAPQ